MALTFTPLDDDVSRELQRSCGGGGAMPAGEVVVSPPGVVITNNYKHYAQRILDLEVREDDTWVISFPKCGSAWTREMVWLLSNNINFEKAKVKLGLRFPFLEAKALFADGNDWPDNIKKIDTMISPRFIKTHLPLELLPKQIWTQNPKVIYVARNPNDVSISYFYHHRIGNHYIGSQDLFLQAFLEDKVEFSPFWQHVLSFWKIRDRKNVHFITFEDMKKDLASVMKGVAVFLGVSYTESEEKALLDHLSFAKMKDNPAINDFMRQGEAGAWKKEMPQHFQELFDKWTEKNLAGSDYPRSILNS